MRFFFLAVYPPPPRLIICFDVAHDFVFSKIFLFISHYKEFNSPWRCLHYEFEAKDCCVGGFIITGESSYAVLTL